jgi:hypothetical protein
MISGKKCVKYVMCLFSLHLLSETFLNPKEFRDLHFYVGQVNVKVKFTPEEATKAQRGSRGIALLFSLTSTLDGDGWSTPHPGHLITGKDPVPIV